METREAKVIKKEDNIFLELSLEEKKFEISLTEDKPNDVKNVFNELIIELKKGEYNFALQDKQNDLYSLISDEYIKQLNVELQNVYRELSDYNLTEQQNQSNSI